MHGQNSRVFLVRCYVALACAGVILWLSLIPGPAVPDIPLFGWDKLQHATAYAVLTYLCGRAFDIMTPASLKGWRRGVLTAIGFGALIEVLQGACTATRTADAGDFMANATGALVVCLAVAIARYRRGEGKEHHET